MAASSTAYPETLKSIRTCFLGCTHTRNICLYTVPKYDCPTPLLVCARIVLGLAWNAITSASQTTLTPVFVHCECLVVHKSSVLGQRLVITHKRTMSEAEHNWPMPDYLFHAGKGTEGWTVQRYHTTHMDYILGVSYAQARYIHPSVSTPFNGLATVK